jgi:hypothetical protein
VHLIQCEGLNVLDGWKGMICSPKERMYILIGKERWIPSVNGGYQESINDGYQ